MIGQRAFRSKKYVSFKGGNQWGNGGRWTEDYDEAAAKETLDRLQNHWQRFKKSMGVQAFLRLDCGSESDVDNDAAEEVANGACTHVACSRQSFCILEHLTLAKQKYQGKSNQFRIKAIDRAVR